jgi:fibronectin-binding autotransporter adhesin
MKTPLLHFLLPMAFLATAHGGTHVWSGAGANTSWSNPANWSSGGVPVVGEVPPVKLVFPANAVNRTSAPNISNLKVDAIEVDVSGVNYYFTTTGIPLTLTGAAGDNFKVTGFGGNVVWQPAVSLQSTCRVNLTGSPSSLDFQGVVAGSGGITKQGVGSLKFSTGSAANTFTGTFRIEGGNVSLGKVAGTPCFSGKLELAGGGCSIERSHQIPDTSAIELAGGMFSAAPGAGVASVSETLGNITFSANSTLRAYTNAAITISGTVACADQAGLVGVVHASDTGSISLGGGTKTISVPNAGSQISIDASIGNGATVTGIVKSGAGMLKLHRANTFTGAVEVKGGMLEVNHATSLGTTAGATTVREGAVLVIGEPMTLPAGEKIILEGTLESYENAEVPGEVVLGGSPRIKCSYSKALKMSGVISGNASELVIDQGGPVEWNGAQANTYSAITKLNASATLVLNKSSGNAMPGPVQFSGGTLSLAASNQIADSAPVWFSSSGILKLNGYSETVLQVYGTTQGQIQLGSGSLTFAGNNSVNLGSQDSNFRITGTAASSIHKKGSGTLTIYRGEEIENGNELTALHVESGKVRLFRYWQGPVHVTGGTLEGSASTGMITNQGGTLSLSEMQSKGVNTLAGGGTYVCSLTSEVPGTGFGVIEVTGGINLTGMTLDLSVGYLPMNGSTYTLLDNDGSDPVIGTFNGLPEGAMFIINGRPFTITYKAGVGSNNVMIRFVGTGTPGPEITAVQPQGNGSVRIDMKWEPGKIVTLERAYHRDLGQWSTHGSYTMDAQGKATVTVQVFGSTSEFFRLRTNPQ